MKVKKLLIILTAVILAMALLPVTALADESGTSALVRGKEPLLTGVNTANAQVLYYGQNSWYMIGTGKDGFGATLLAKNGIGESYFDNSENKSHAYANSELRTWIETEGMSSFSGNEKSFIDAATLDDLDPKVENALLWPLSITMARSLDQTLRSLDPEHADWISGWWWLRTPGEKDHTVDCVKGNGSIDHYGSPVGESGYTGDDYYVPYRAPMQVRPAFYLKLDSVLFTSAAEGGKPFGEEEGILQPVGTNANNEWKLTLKDSSHSGFTARRISECRKDGSFDIEYSGAATGDKEWISAIIVSGDGTENEKITYYGRIKNCIASSDASGTISINLRNIISNDDIFYLFNEEYNGDKATDFASELQLIEGPYDLVDYTITTEAEHGSVEAPATAQSGDQVTVNTVPDEGYELAKLTYAPEGGEEIDITEVGAFEMPTANVVVKAVFRPKTFTLTFDLSGGTLNGKTGTYTMECEYGSTIRLPEAPVKEGCKFLYWKGSKYEAGAEYIVKGAHNFTAVWEETSPQTGDSTNAGFWVVLLGGSLLAAILLITFGREYLKKQR